MNILISACLLGVNCKYSGGNNLNENLIELLDKYVLIPVCPEQLGGLNTPRLPAEICGGDGRSVLSGNAKVLCNNRDDVTKQFIKGASEAIKIAKLYSCKYAILKANSPSCGYFNIYDGSFMNKIKEGNGVTAQLLLDNGIVLMSEKEKISDILGVIQNKSKEYK